MSTKGAAMRQEEVFDRMAPGWYNRRHWTIFRQELEELAGRWERGRLLNVGCGHGADFLPFAGGFELHGLDFSAGMLRFAVKYAHKFDLDAKLVRGDVASLPFASGAFDWAIAVASYHHLMLPGSRRTAFAELRRVLRPGGEAFVTVWNRWQPAFWLKPKEIYVKWRTKEADLARYYYLFSRRELEGMLREAGFTVLRSYAEAAYHFPIAGFSRNVCLLLARVD
jgi:tRNA (uracil-5-)-methyltransferase TRM9